MNTYNNNWITIADCFSVGGNNRAIPHINLRTTTWTDGPKVNGGGQESEKDRDHLLCVHRELNFMPDMRIHIYWGYTHPHIYYTLKYPSNCNMPVRTFATTSVRVHPLDGVCRRSRGSKPPELTCLIWCSDHMYSTAVQFIASSAILIKIYRFQFDGG